MAVSLRIAIVGAGGQLGGWLVDEFTRSGGHVLPLTRRDGDVTTPAFASVLARLRPDVIVNATAWNDVDGAEDHPAAAMAVNRDAVFRLAETARSAGAVFVHYSTDFVFDGHANEPYAESTAPSPLNHYGASKWAGEQAALLAPRHYVLRLSSVFGGQVQRGGVGKGTIDRIIDSLCSGTSVTAFVDRTVSPSYAPDVARVTRELIERVPPYGIYHCVSSGFTTWHQLVLQLRDQLGASGEVCGANAADVRLRAERPRFCAMSNAKLLAAGFTLPGWRDALDRHLRHRGLASPISDVGPHR